MRAPDPAVAELTADAYEVPTPTPQESDGTLTWASTTLVLVHARADDGTHGIGWTYAHAAATRVIAEALAPVVAGADALAPGAAWERMHVAIRQLGHAGLAAMALSAVDVALWDLKARLLGRALADVLPRVRDATPAYGSGGFADASEQELRAQVERWRAQGFARIKVKVGREPAHDPARLRIVRDAAGPDVELMVDGNGAYGVSEALRWARRFAGEHGATWFEEPVSSQDRAGLRRVREGAPPGLAIAAGEYAWELTDLMALRDAGAVDVLQADVSRCGGVTGMLGADGLCCAAQLPLSAHCVPSIMAHVGCALRSLIHCEHFADHERVEHLLFDGAPQPVGGQLRPDRARAGLGLELKAADAARWAVAHEAVAA